MPKTFDCPKCGAPVGYDNIIGANLTARCPYCNSSLSVPDELHGRPAQVIFPVNIKIDSGTGARATKWILLMVFIPVFAVVIVIIALGGFLAPFVRNVAPTARPSPLAGPSRTNPNPIGVVPAPGFATTVLDFGSKGIGPGMFTDARSIAVDGSGKIYVGEYINGRIQVFDAAGKFITQWSVDPKMPLRGLAADRQGTVYVVQHGKISRFEGETGKALGELEYANGWGFDDVATTADGGLVTAWYKSRDDIVRFDSSSKVTRTIPAAISSITDSSELNTRVAVDGLGNVYALGSFNNAVFKFTPEGKFVTRFGDAGEQAGQFRAPSAIAVDGKGRVFVSDIKGIQVFDASGRYLNVFKGGGTASGMVFNDKNELFVAAREHVIKLKINE
jgi:DNA-binding beta-propeller fold protein YncE